jgi:predicted O-methyltransferase YrrM
MASLAVVRRRVPDFVKTAVLYARRRAALRRLHGFASGDEQVTRLLRCVEETLRGALPPDERDWVGGLLAIRRRLRRSREIIIHPLDPPVAQTLGERYLVSKAPLAALLLFRLVREFKPTRCLELGTNLGVSAAYQAAALELNGGGALDTLEGSRILAGLAQRHLAELELAVRVHRGRFQDLLPGLLPRLEPLDYVFVDGHHDQQATIGYFAQLYPHLTPGALVVFDDIAWSEGMAEAWRVIQADERVRVALSVGSMGVTLVGGEGARIRMQLPFPG